MSSIISVISYYFLEGKTVNTEQERPNKSAKSLFHLFTLPFACQLELKLANNSSVVCVPDWVTK